MEDTESSTLQSHPSTFLRSTINWIMYSRNWNVLQKLTMHFDSFWTILRMECVDTLTLTRTLLLSKDLNLCVHKLICLTWKTEGQKMDIVDVCTRDRANTKWKLYKLTILNFFASLLKDVPVSCKDTVVHEPRLKNHNWNALLLRKIRDNPTLTISACSEHELYICMVKKHWRRRLLNFSTFYSIPVGKEMSQISEVFIRMTFQKLKTCGNSISSFMILIL